MSHRNVNYRRNPTYSQNSLADYFALPFFYLFTRVLTPPNFYLVTEYFLCFVTAIMNFILVGCVCIWFFAVETDILFCLRPLASARLSIFTNFFSSSLDSPESVNLYPIQTQIAPYDMLLSSSFFGVRARATLTHKKFTFESQMQYFIVWSANDANYFSCNGEEKEKINPKLVDEAIKISVFSVSISVVLLAAIHINAIFFPFHFHWLPWNSLRIFMNQDLTIWILGCCNIAIGIWI